MVECITATPDALGNYWEDPAYIPIVDDSLLLWLTSDFGNNVTWTDISGKGNHGTIEGAAREPLYSPDIFGSALRFNGLNNYVNSGSSINVTSHITVEVEIKAMSLSGGHCIVNKMDDKNISPNWGNNWRLTQYNKGVVFHLFDGDNIFEKGAYDVIGEMDTLYHFAAISNGVDMMVYTNGEPYGTPTPAPSSILPSSADLIIGSAQKIGQWYNGTIATIRIYNRALSNTERIHNYTHSLTYHIRNAL